MKKAVMYGGGNIGRGFIGMLFSASGYEVTFVDVAEPVVNTLNEKHCYPVRIISNQGHTDIVVNNVRAVNGNDGEAVAAAIANADIMATAVGVNVLKFIIPNIVAGIRKRTLIITLPGSKKASAENVLAVIDPVAHGLDMLYSEGSADCAK